MPLPLWALAVAGGIIGGGLGYLGHRESMRAYSEAMKTLEGIPSPTADLVKEIQKYGLRYALEKYGYNEVRQQLEQVYKSQISSILQRAGRQLALAGVPSGINPMAVVGKLREGLDIAYLAQSANLPFEMLQSVQNLLSGAFQEEYAKRTAIAGLQAQKPSLVQDVLSGISAGVGIGSAFASFVEQPDYAKYYGSKPYLRKNQRGGYDLFNWQGGDRPRRIVSSDGNYVFVWDENLNHYRRYHKVRR